MKSERAGPACVVGPLVGRLNNGDAPVREWIGEHAPRTGDAGRPFAEPGAEFLRLGAPFVAKARRPRQELVAARPVTAVDRLFNHFLSVVSCQSSVVHCTLSSAS